MTSRQLFQGIARAFYLAIALHFVRRIVNKKPTEDPDAARILMTKDAYMNHYKVHYRVTEKPNALNGLTCRKVEFTIELDAKDYKSLMKKLYYKCISGRGILYYEILNVSINSFGY